MEGTIDGRRFWIEMGWKEVRQGWKWLFLEVLPPNEITNFVIDIVGYSPLEQTI